MWKLSRKSEYALMIVQRLGVDAQGEPMAAAALAQAGDLPRDLIAKVLQDLRHAGVVESTRGVAGGYRLTRPLAAIGFLEVIRPFEEHLGLADCVDTDGACRRAEGCTLQGPVARLNHWLMGHLRQLSMAEFVGARGAGGEAPLAAGATAQDATAQLLEASRVPRMRLEGRRAAIDAGR